MDYSISFIFLLIAISNELKVCVAHSTNSLLMVVSFDGLRWDYFDLMKSRGVKLTNFDRFFKEGSKAEYLNPVFPSLTYPAHWSIATGLYPENNGVIQNEIWDPVINDTFEMYVMNKESDARWFNNDDTVEPIWITNQKGPQTIFHRRSGTISWPGDEAVYGGQVPNHHMSFENKLNASERLKEALSWFATEDHPVNFGMVYLLGVDAEGHKYGPDSKEVQNKLIQLDTAVGELLNGIDNHHLSSKLNVIFLSDHGMTTYKKIVHIDDYLNNTLYTKYGYSPIWQIVPRKDKKEEVIQGLQKLTTENPEVKLYSDRNTPPNYHYSKHRRIQPILLIAENGVGLAFNSSSKMDNGTHGFFSSMQDMRAFFAARGPAIKVGGHCPPVNQVDIYPFMCHILGLHPLPNDGSLDVIGTLLEEEHDNFYVTLVTFLVCVGFAATVAGVCCVAACRIYHISRIRRRRIDLPLGSVLNSDVKKALLSSDEEEI